MHAVVYAQFLRPMLIIPFCKVTLNRIKYEPKWKSLCGKITPYLNC